MADAGVEAHGWAAGDGDGQPFVRAGRGFKGTCMAHGGGLVGGNFSVAERGNHQTAFLFGGSNSLGVFSELEPRVFVVRPKAHSKKCLWPPDAPKTGTRSVDSEGSVMCPLAKIGSPKKMFMRVAQNQEGDPDSLPAPRVVGCLGPLLRLSV
jgi:hypothetical protein